MIRNATENDITQIVEMGAAMHAESPRYRDLAFSKTKLAGLAQGILRGVIPGGILIAEEDGILVGMFSFVVTETFFGTDKAAYDLVVYVSPEFRGRSVFARLVLAAEQSAREMGACEFQVGITTGVQTEKVQSAFNRMGYGSAGVNVVKRL